MKNDVIFQLSVRSIRLHFLRSVLAALGIVIGVVAISSMGMMGANMTMSVTEELSAMANVLVVKADTGGGGGSMFSAMGSGSSTTRRSSSSTSTKDYLTGSNFDDVERAVGSYGTVYPLYQDSTRIEVGDNTGRATIYGMIDDDMPNVLTIAEGTLPKTSSSVVVGPTFASRQGLTIGSRITIGDATQDETVSKFRVVGILEQKGMSMDMNTDNAIIMTEKAYVGLFGGEEEYDQVNVILKDISDADTTKTAITDKLNRKENVVTIQDSSRMMESITSTVSTLTTFVMAIAGISLLVAATSIFNVMMMSVTERIREIGILRSIGTRKSEIRRMFLYEASILGLVGTGIGAIMSLILGWLVVLAMVGTTKYFFTYSSLIYVPMAMAIGIAICIFSGVYPAWRAANLDPIEALRSD
ncbi:ABC transporter permease [Methanoregula sp.]|uniref:ABC transporter permease n=1 Tax=Methanoregula sp. TaxID=2052170 RepID=UPI000CBF2B3A|nr:ABC transporter permease [Methanoregula sp.]PKG33366.1 MAG: ABC transporter permease [Methanoregula sp.]